jgi:hypothetical protein
MKNVNVKKVVLAVGAAVALSAGVMQSAQADSIFFPYYKVGNGAYSFLSLHQEAGTAATFNQSIHIWQWKLDASNKTSACVHEDAYGKTSPWDLIQQTVESPDKAMVPGGNGVDLKTMFADGSTPNYSLQSPAQGFLTVSNNTAVEDDIRGQMIVIDTVSGMVAAYKGFNNPVAQAERTWNSIFTSHASYDMTWYPTTESGSKLGAAGVNTSWFVSVTGQDVTDTNWAGAVTLTNGFLSGNVYDRDENPRSGFPSLLVRCFAEVQRSDVMTSTQVTHTVNGGFTWQVATPTGASGVIGDGTNSTGILMTKVEATTALGAKKTMVSAENAFPNLPY